MTDLLPEPEPGGAAPQSGKQSGLLRASGITGSMTLVSRILGLARDVAIARVFGTSEGADAFLLANRIPNFMRRLFAEGAFNQAFVPVLSEYRSMRSLADVQLLISGVAGSLGGFLFLLTCLIIVAAPVVAIPIGFGWYTDQPAKFALFVEMLQITFPYLFLISMTALCGSILNSYGKFAIPAITPALLNVSLIASAFFLVPFMRVPELALAWGVLIAGVAQLLFQLPLLARMRLLPKPRIVKGHEGVTRIKRLMIPALFGVSISQINMLLDSIIASFLVTGSVSWLYYSDRLMELPLGTFGIAIAVAVLPSLSRKHAESSTVEFTETLDWGLRIVSLIAIPAMLGLILIAEPLMITLFQNDNFTERDVINSANSLRAYALGLLAFMSIKIFAPGFYARQNTKTPVVIGVIAMTANMVMNIAFYLLGMAHVGLALATSLAAYLNAGLLMQGLRKDGVFSFQAGWMIFLLRLAAANIAMSMLLIMGMGDWQAWLKWEMFRKVVQLSALVVGSVLVYGFTLFAAGLRWKDVHR